MHSSGLVTSPKYSVESCVLPVGIFLLFPLEHLSGVDSFTTKSGNSISLFFSSKSMLCFVFFFSFPAADSHFSFVLVARHFSSFNLTNLEKGPDFCLTELRSTDVL